MFCLVLASKHTQYALAPQFPCGATHSRSCLQVLGGPDAAVLHELQDWRAPRAHAGAPHIRVRHTKEGGRKGMLLTLQASMHTVYWAVFHGCRICAQHSAAPQVNMEMGLLDRRKGDAIVQAATEVGHALPVE